MEHEHEHKEGEPELGQKELEERLKAYRAAQQLYIEQNFKWLIDFIRSYFPDDQLAIRDLDLEVHFIHQAVEGGKTLGALAYRFRKFINKGEYFKEMAEDYREGLKLPEVFFVDTETSKFQEVQENDLRDFAEIPPEKLAGRIRELREELIKKAKLRQLKESL